MKKESESELESEKSLLIIAKYMHSGLCNQLKNVLSCVRIQQHLNGKIYIESNNILHTLFDFPEKWCQRPDAENIQEIYEREDWRFAIFDTDKNLDKIIDHPLSILFPNFQEHRFFPNYQNNCIDTVYRPDLFHDIYLEYKHIFEEFAIKKNIHEIMERYADRYLKDKNKVVSVHIRSWIDHGPRGEQFHIESFFSKIEEWYILHPDYIFFISSDNRELSLAIQRKFGEDKIKIYTPEEGELPLVSAFIEVMLLSRNNILMGTHLSTFTEMAYIINYHQEKQIIII